MRTTLSIHDFSGAGMLKLYMGCADHQHVGPADLCDQRVAFGEHAMHPRRAQRLGRVARLDPFAGDHTGRLRADVAVDHFVVRTGGLPGRDKTVAQAARVRAVLGGARKAGAGAGVDVEQGGHGVVLGWVDGMNEIHLFCLTRFEIYPSITAATNDNFFALQKN
jgi:hypothetical protein